MNERRIGLRPMVWGVEDRSKNGRSRSAFFEWLHATGIIEVQD
jgi:hypothetical protein